MNTRVVSSTLKRVEQENRRNGGEALLVLSSCWLLARMTTACGPVARDPSGDGR